MSYASVVVNLDEIWLKGLNRKFYIKVLRKNIRKTVAALSSADFQYHAEGPKHILESEQGFSNEVIEALIKIPGINSVSPSEKVGLDLEEVRQSISRYFNGQEEMPKTFRITTKRSNKKFPLTSMEVDRQIGGWVKAEFGIPPRMVNPDLTITLRIIEDSIYVSTQTIKAVGGLPVGTSGHVVCMLSGGFDSPVASYLLSKRGTDQTFVFFHAYPYVGEEVLDKISELTRVLSQYQRFAKLFIVPFGEIQKKIADHCKPDYRTVLFRKYMVKTANQLAEKVGAQAIVTGDALSQVSSQTLENMAAMDQASDRPILRPLIGYNKVEIIDLSRQIGTHDISVQPHDDACSLFAPKHPVIRADQRYCAKFGENLGFDESIEKALWQSQLVYFNKTGERNEESAEAYFAKGKRPNKGVSL